MRRIILWVASALLTLALGVAAVRTWYAYHKTQSFPLVTEMALDTAQINTGLGKSEIPTVVLCELTRHPELYWHREIRVWAILVADREKVVMSLLDQDCGVKPVWIEAWCDDRTRQDQCLELKESLDRFLGEGAARKPITAKVEAVGMFWPYDEDPYRHRLFIRELTRAEILKAKVPRPPRVKRGPC